jgi:alginate O-acetyltransferase complex protein AlgJ
MRYPIHSRFAAIALVATMALGAWQMTAALAPLDRAAIPATVADFREGRTTGELQKRLERAMPWREAMVATANALRYVLLHGAGDDVRLGRDGWLFLADELRFGPGSAKAMRERLALLDAANRALAARGILLVVALVPDKARVYERYLRDERVPAEHAGRYAQALRALRAGGVAVVDLLAPLGAAADREPLYYRTDTHWNHAGARIAANAIAEEIRARGVKLPVTRFRGNAGVEAERPGDLIRLMGLEHAPARFRPAADRERPYTTEEAAEGAGASLLGDFQVPAVLLGTSYSMRANFHGFLQEALSARVLNAARDGAGFIQSANEYFGDEAFRASPPQVVIWEVPERVLSEKMPSPEALPFGGRPARPRS